MAESFTSLEVEIERAWFALGVIPDRLYLTQENGSSTQVKRGHTSGHIRKLFR